MGGEEQLEPPLVTTAKFCRRASKDAQHLPPPMSEIVLSSPTLCLFLHYSNPYSTSSSTLHDFFVTFYWPFELIVFGYFNRMFLDCSGKWNQLNLPSTPFCSVFSLMRDRRQAGLREMLILFKSNSRQKKKKKKKDQRLTACCARMSRCEQRTRTWGLCSKNAIFNLHCRTAIKTPAACLVRFNNIFRRHMQY